MPSNCDFSSALLLQGAGPFVETFDTPGDYYYGCSIGAHCSDGAMVLKVTVNAPPELPTPTIAAIPALGSIATISLIAALAAGLGIATRRVR